MALAARPPVRALKWWQAEPILDDAERSGRARYHTARRTSAGRWKDPWRSYGHRGPPAQGDPLTWFALPSAPVAASVRAGPRAEPFPEHFGERLREALEVLELSASGAAQLLGVSYGTIRRWLASPTRPEHPCAVAVDALLDVAAEGA